MNLKVNQDKCIGCGQCVSICEDVFNFNDDGLAEVIETPVKEEHIEDATNAKSPCPTATVSFRNSSTNWRTAQNR